MLEPIDPPEDHDCEEELPEGRVPREATAESRGWGPGWPTDNSSKLAVVRAGGIALSVRRELAPLVQWLVTEVSNRGYVLRHGECWGFANRPIRGTRRPSNHSWGLAIDLNSLTNPMQATKQTDMPGWMVELWTARSFRWGGDYQGRKDPMHFEFMGRPEDAHRHIATLGLDAGPPTLRRGATGDEVRWLQARLNAHGATLEVDGDFGGGTEAAVKAFQQEKGLEADGIVGAKTWAALG